MEASQLKARIESLDPITHGALRERLITRYRQLTDQNCPEPDGYVQNSHAIEPYLDTAGSLVIPFSSKRRYHWWNGGQSISDTLREIEGKLRTS